MSTSDVIKLVNVRLSFPRLFRPKAFEEGQTPRFEASFLLDPADKAHKKLIAQINKTGKALAEDFWNGKVPKGVKYCYGLAEDDEVKADYDGYEGMFYLASANTTRPVVIGRDRAPLVEEDGKPYAGCFVVGTVTLWVQDNKWGKRVNANLRGVQFDRDGEAFGMKPVDAEEEFDVLDGDETDDEEWDD